MTVMQVVEQHLIRKTDSRFAAIDRAAFASKNLYNQANYQIRQAYIHEGRYLPYGEIFHRLKHHEAYYALPRKVSNSILIQLHQSWLSFFKGNKEYQADPSKFVGRPNNQQFVQIPHARFIEMLTYKARLVGKRVQRGLYRASDGRRIHADVNGSYNILRKAFPNSFGQGIEAPAVVSRRLAV
jgi:putative transposase